MKKLSKKICFYSLCESPEFEGTSGQKFCNNHRNKVCRKCNTIKEECNWDWRSLCKACESKRVSEYLKRKRKENPDFFKTEVKRAQARERRKKYYHKYPDKAKSYYQKNKEKIKIRQKEYYLKNRESRLASSKNWIELNKDYHKAMNNKNTIEWRKRNPHIVAWRNMVHRVLNQFGKKKADSTHNILGYSANQLKLHIENQFKNGMSWNNYGSWHIDHIIPVMSFSRETHPSIVNALSNLRPLWQKENLKRKRK